MATRHRCLELKHFSSRDRSGYGEDKRIFTSLKIASYSSINFFFWYKKRIGLKKGFVSLSMLAMKMSHRLFATNKNKNKLTWICSPIVWCFHHLLFRSGCSLRLCAMDRRNDNEWFVMPHLAMLICCVWARGNNIHHDPMTSLNFQCHSVPCTCPISCCILDFRRLGYLWRFRCGKQYFPTMHNRLGTYHQQQPIAVHRKTPSLCPNRELSPSNAANPGPGIPHVHVQQLN